MGDLLFSEEKGVRVDGGQVEGVTRRRGWREGKLQLGCEMINK